MRRALLLVPLAVAVLAVSAAALYAPDKNNESYQPGPYEGGGDAEGGVNGLAWQVFDAAGDGSIVFSPYGLYTALGVLMNGAEPGSATEKEIAEILGVKDAPSLNTYIRSLGTPGEKVVFSSTNLVIADSGILKETSMDPDFVKILEDVFSGRAEEADFSGNLPAAKESIRKWVSECTGGFIPDYQSVATDRTVLDILNAVYLKADWARKFGKESTDDADFRCMDGQVRQVRMMGQVFHGLKVYQDEKYKGAELLYEDGSTAMFIVIPRNGSTDMLEMWRSETPEYRESFMESIRKADPGRTVRFSMPAFESAQALDLVEILAVLGVEDSFTDAARYTCMVEGQSLHVDAAKHQAKIKVDEAGTEAAAVTEISMAKNSVQVGEFIDFRCDIPFVYTVSLTSDGTDLFVGFYGGPSE